MIDHSVQVDVFGTRLAFARNAELEFERNQERYAFLRWGQDAFENFRVVPPDTGIVHQVNLEYLARGRVRRRQAARRYPDTLVGTDSHTTMINGLGVLGWGVGGIEAEAAMLGQPISMLIPQVVGFKLTGRAAGGRDRDRPGADRHPDAPQARASSASSSSSTAPAWRTCRSPTARRSPTWRRSIGATCGIFPIDAETLRYLELSGRPPELIGLVEAYAKEQGLFHDEQLARSRRIPTRSSSTSATVEPSLAGPKRPQDRVSLHGVQGGVPARARGLSAGQ